MFGVPQHVRGCSQPSAIRRPQLCFEVSLLRFLFVGFANALFGSLVNRFGFRVLLLGFLSWGFLWISRLALVLTLAATLRRSGLSLWNLTIVGLCLGLRDVPLEPLVVDVDGEKVRTGWLDVLLDLLDLPAKPQLLNALCMWSILCPIYHIYIYVHLFIYIYIYMFICVFV